MFNFRSGKIAVWFVMLTSMATYGGYISAADSSETPRQILSKLSQEMFAIGETKSSQENFRLAVKEASRKVMVYSSVQKDTGPLIEKYSNGATPLMAAAYLRYDEFVAALLSNSDVVASINDADKDGLTAWILANFALEETLWLCNPTIAGDPFKILPIVEATPYYAGDGEHPYRKTRRLLEEAGAKPDMRMAKQLWLDKCKLAKPEVRQKVASSDDLLLTLETESPSGFAALTAKNPPAQDK